MQLIKHLKVPFISQCSSMTGYLNDSYRPDKLTVITSTKKKCIFDITWVGCKSRWLLDPVLNHLQELPLYRKIY